MEDKDSRSIDIIDEDLYEDISDEEMAELVQQGREKVLAKERIERANRKNKRPFPSWAFWLIALAMILNLFALVPQTISVPAIDFLMTSAKLSSQTEIKEYKKAVVVIESDNSRGTGFSISDHGKIITNYHVIEGEETVTVAFPNDGLYKAEVIDTFPDIDLAVLDVNGSDLPYLHLASELSFTQNEHIHFIGNPLRFQGIANEGYILDYVKLSSWEKEVVMIQAPIYRGNSGSPIINENGEVIGVVFATIKHDEHGKVGLFVPIDYYYEAI